MSLEENKRIVRQYIECLQIGDAEGLVSLLAPNFAWWIPTMDQPDGVTMGGGTVACCRFGGQRDKVFYQTGRREWIALLSN